MTQEGVDLGLSPCLESHWGASQFKFSTSGGKLQLALNHELCAEADGSGLRIAKCAENHPKQDFMLNYSLIVGRGSDPSCIMAKPSKALKLAKSCRSEPEVEALTSGCEEIIHPHIKVTVLRASGKKDSRNEDRDANPLNDSIPGEVVRRNEKSQKSGPSTKALAETDIAAVLAKGSGTREKWLKKALQQVHDGELQAVDIYNILKVPDFASDLKDKTGRSMYKFLMSRISVFSKGQQRFLAKECSLAQMFGGEGQRLCSFPVQR
eukprot:g27217.t1